MESETGMKRITSRRVRYVAAGFGVLLTVAVALSVVLLQSRPAHASGVGYGCLTANGTPACTFSGDSAVLDFNTFDPGSTSCGVWTGGWLFVTQNVQRGGGAPEAGSHITLFVYKQDTCSGNVVMDANGEATNVNFKESGVLDTMTVNTTVPLFDWVSQSTINATVSMTWKGEGPTTSYMDSSHFRTQYYFGSAHYTSDSRLALATGSISVGAAPLFAVTSLQASVMSAKGGQLFISQQQ